MAMRVSSSQQFQRKFGAESGAREREKGGSASGLGAKIILPPHFRPNEVYPDNKEPMPVLFNQYTKEMKIVIVSKNLY